MFFWEKHGNKKETSDFSFTVNEIEKNICSIWLPSYEEDSVICKLIKKFQKGDELFFHCYREDGNFNDDQDIIKYREEIPKYFKKYGRYEIIFDYNQTKKLKYFDPSIEVIGSLPLNEKTLKFIPNICNYYLETAFFVPNKVLTWDVFSQIMHSDSKKNLKYFIDMGYFNERFSHFDGGIFAFTFNKTKYDIGKVLDSIKTIVGIDEKTAIVDEKNSSNLTRFKIITN